MLRIHREDDGTSPVAWDDGTVAARARGGATRVAGGGLQESKRALAEALITADRRVLGALNREDVEFLLG